MYVELIEKHIYCVYIEIFGLNRKLKKLSDIKSV